MTTIKLSLEALEILEGIFVTAPYEPKEVKQRVEIARAINKALSKAWNEQQANERKEK